MNKPIVVVAIEGLSTSMLGSYGGPWCRTTRLDSFAAASVVFDEVWTEHLALKSQYSKIVRTSLLGDEEESWLRSLSRSGLSSMLVTDRESMLDWDFVGEFDHVLDIELPREQQESLADCGMSRLFLRAIEAWLSHDEDVRPELLWIHSTGWNGSWDAPQSIRDSLRDEEDPPSFIGTKAPALAIRDDEEFEKRISWVQAAAAQAMVLDEAWQFIELTAKQLHEESNSRVNLGCALIGLSGFPIGEHGWVGTENQLVYSEQTHVPAILNIGEQSQIGSRSNQLSTVPDLARMIGGQLAADYDLETRNESSRDFRGKARQHVVTQSDDWVAIRCGAWSYHIAQDDLRNWKSRLDENMELMSEDEVPLESEVFSSERLFLMPDDRWQQNDVSSRASEVVFRMRQLACQLLFRSEHVDGTAIHPMISDRPD